MRKSNHLSEYELLELMSQKEHRASVYTDHLSSCTSCQNELSSLNKAVRVLQTVKNSREERLRLLNEGVVQELHHKRAVARTRIPAIAAALVLLTFGIYFYTSMFMMGVTVQNAGVIGSTISYVIDDEAPQMYVQAHNVSVIGSHSTREATSRSIVSSVVRKGEVQYNGQSQQDSVSVSPSHIIITTSTSL